VTVVVIPAADQSVTIFASGNIVGILAVFALDPVVVLHRQLGHGFMKYGPLIQEIIRGIVTDSVLRSIPLVAPPAFDAINRKSACARPVNRDHVFAAKVTVATVDIPFIPEGKPALLPTDRAMFGWRYRIFFSAENRRNGIIKNQILGGYVISFSAMVAGFLH